MNTIRRNECSYGAAKLIFKIFCIQTANHFSRNEWTASNNLNRLYAWIIIKYITYLWYQNVNTTNKRLECLMPKKCLYYHWQIFPFTMVFDNELLLPFCELKQLVTIVTVLKTKILHGSPTDDDKSKTFTLLSGKTRKIQHFSFFS